MCSDVIDEGQDLFTSCCSFKKHMAGKPRKYVIKAGLYLIQGSWTVYLRVYGRHDVCGTWGISKSWVSRRYCRVNRPDFSSALLAKKQKKKQSQANATTMHYMVPVKEKQPEGRTRSWMYSLIKTGTKKERVKTFVFILYCFKVYCFVFLYDDSY